MLNIAQSSHSINVSVSAAHSLACPQSGFLRLMEGKITESILTTRRINYQKKGNGVTDEKRLG